MRNTEQREWDYQVALERQDATIARLRAALAEIGKMATTTLVVNGSAGARAVDASLALSGIEDMVHAALAAHDKED